jgi:tRNA1Val (adenine37-N6)-methyltransferase
MTEIMAVNDNLTLRSKNGSLDFGTDAYLLSCFIRRNTKATAAEFGAGNGIISMLVASRKTLGHITCCEIQKELCDIARTNIKENELEDMIEIKNCDVSDCSFGDNYDVVFSNPPYLRTGTGKENENESDRICCREVYGSIDSFSRAASSSLKYGDLFYTVYRPDRIAELIHSQRKYGLEPKRITLVYPSVEHVPCLVLCESKKGGGEGVFITRPLIIYNKSNTSSQKDYTEDMKYIYEHGEFNEYFLRP